MARSRLALCTPRPPRARPRRPSRTREVRSRETQMIQVQNVTKAFAGKKLFEEVETMFPPGRRYGLTGPNGAGKTTFMKILSGDLEPDTGVISRPKRTSVLNQNQF